MKDYSNYRSNIYDNIRWSGVKFFERQLEYEGENILIDGVQTKAIIRSHTNQFNATNGDRKLLCSLDTDIHRGSIIDYDNSKWIVFVDISNDKTCLFTKILKTTHTITLNKNHILYNIPCIVESAVRLYQLGDKDNKYLTEPSTNIIIRVPNNDITRLIKRSDVYKIGMQNYRVVDVNDVIESGLLVLKMEFALSEQPKDSITTVTILNGEEINMNYQGQTLQLNVEVKVNDEIIPNPEITYISSNEDIATVDENGLVTTILNGICTITATYNDVSDSIDINSVTIIPDDFEIVLTPTNANTIKIGTSLVLEAHAMNNGVEDLTKHFNWYLINVDGSSNTYATIVSNDKTCTIVASNSYSHINKYIKIKAELVGDVTVFTEKQIKLISLI